MDKSVYNLHFLIHFFFEFLLTHKIAYYLESESNSTKLKAPSWTADQLREAIESVVTQKMRFTQASMKYNIPKGTLYDNILGKSNRMEVLVKSGLNTNDENVVLEFCCDLSASPYNRRTRKPLSEILQFVYRLESCNHQVFDESNRFAFRWWWAFCKKYSIVSLHYDNNANIKINRNWFMFSWIILSYSVSKKRNIPIPILLYKYIDILFVS